MPDNVDHLSHAPVLLMKEDLKCLQEECTVEDLGGHKVSGYIYPSVIDRTTNPQRDPDEITQALLQREDAQEALFEEQQREQYAQVRKHRNPEDQPTERSEFWTKFRSYT